METKGQLFFVPEPIAPSVQMYLSITLFCNVGTDGARRDSQYLEAENSYHAVVQRHVKRAAN